MTSVSATALPLPTETSRKTTTHVSATARFRTTHSVAVPAHLRLSHRTWALEKMLEDIGGEDRQIHERRWKRSERI
jgi:hypothetical protein